MVRSVCLLLVLSVLVVGCGIGSKRQAMAFHEEMLALEELGAALEARSGQFEMQVYRALSKPPVRSHAEIDAILAEIRRFHDEASARVQTLTRLADKIRDAEVKAAAHAAVETRRETVHLLGAWLDETTDIMQSSADLTQQAEDGTLHHAEALRSAVQLFSNYQRFLIDWQRRYTEIAVAQRAADATWHELLETRYKVTFIDGD